MSEMKSSSTVAGMLHQITDDAKFASEFEKRAEGRSVVNQLIAHRLKCDLSQDDVAKRLKRSQSKVSKFEHSSDADTRLGDVIDYAKATGLVLTLSLSEKGKSAVDEIKYHAFRIKELLEHIVTLAGNDVAMIDGAKHFVALEVPLNLLKIVVDVASKLPTTDVPDEESAMVIENRTEVSECSAGR